jgi:hypothetical protein
VATAEPPASLPGELRCADGIRIVGLRAVDADAQRRLLRALDVTAQDDHTYVLLWAGGLYCSRAALDAADASTNAADADVVDFALVAGLHTPELTEGLEGRPMLAAAAQATAVISQAATGLALSWLHHGVTDRVLAQVLAEQNTLLSDPWREVLRRLVDGEGGARRLRTLTARRPVRRPARAPGLGRH